MDKLKEIAFNDENKDTECCICLEPFCVEEKLKQSATCNHIFHEHCISTWIKDHNTCPKCRTTLFYMPPATTRTIPLETFISYIRLTNENAADEDDEEYDELDDDHIIYTQNMFEPTTDEEEDDEEEDAFHNYQNMFAFDYRLISVEDETYAMRDAIIYNFA